MMKILFYANVHSHDCKRDHDNRAFDRLCNRDRNPDRNKHNILPRYQMFLNT